MIKIIIQWLMEPWFEQKVETKIDRRRFDHVVLGEDREMNRSWHTDKNWR